MIDIENKIVTLIGDAISASLPGVTVSSEYIDTPPGFPAVTITEGNSTVVKRMRTAQAIENGVDVMYEINVYSNKTTGKKAQAKSIMDVVDAAMAGLGFTRTYRNPVPNFNDATIFRLVARYEATVLPEGDNGYRIYTN